MIERVLVPLDGSELAEGVLPFAEELARRLPAEIRLLQVVGLPADLQAVQLTGEIIVDPDLTESQLNEEAQVAEDYLERTAAGMRSRKINVTWEMVRGPAAPSIVQYARSTGIDLIAMSTHGRSGLSRLVFGSVADQVLREGRLPVMLIRPGGRSKPAGRAR